VPSLGLIRTRKHWGRLRFVLALQIAAAAGVPLIGSPPAVGRTGVAVEAENYDEMFRQAKNLFVEKRYRESLKVLERCLALNHQDPETYKLVASNAILIDRMDIAEQALKTAQQLTPDDYAVLFNLGALYYTESRFLQAQPELEKSVKLNSHYVPARLFLGLTQEELGQEAAAIATYLKSIEIAEHSGFQGEQPYLYLGRLMYRQNNVIESLPYLQKAAQANPQSCESLCLLSRVLSSQGRESQAMAAVNQCLNADPDYPEAHYLLSRAYALHGDAEKSGEELTRFQELKKNEQSRKDPRKNQRAIR